MTAFPEMGKIQEDFLKDHVFPAHGAYRREVVSGPQYGVDVSVVAINAQLSLVSATDPVSLIPTMGLKQSAWLSVHLAASDIATAGCLPQYAQFCLNLPPDMTSKAFQEYWNSISEYCHALNVAITGGHTGRIAGQNSTIAGGVTMMSCVDTESVLTSRMARPGDQLVCVKQPAIISTAILALSFPETIEQKCGKEIVRMGEALFEQTSAVDAAMTAVASGIHGEGVRAMHDVTEGGVLGATVEMMTAAGCGVEVDDRKIIRGEAQTQICEAFGLDQRYSIGAGALLLSVAAGHTDKVLKHMHEAGYTASVIGSVLEPEDGMWIIEHDERTELRHPGEDPYWGAFFSALKKGLK